MSGANDLIGHLTPCEYQVDCAGLVFTIPAMDAIGWLKLLLSEPFDLYAIFPEAAGPQAVEHVENMLWEERITTEDVERIGLELISAVADRPWWVVLRVIHAAQGSWDRLHVNAASGKSLAGWLDEVWMRILSSSDPKKLTAWIHEVETPPKGFEGEVDFDDEERAFLAAMKAVM